MCGVIPINMYNSSSGYVKLGTYCKFCIAVIDNSLYYTT